MNNRYNPSHAHYTNESRRRRSSGESYPLARAIRNALDPDFEDCQTNYDDRSILAAVSSAHSSQKMMMSGKNEQKKSRDYDRNSQLSQQLLDDFLSPQKIEAARREHRNHRHRPKQIRMDEYLFKARRIDKGAREFGLKTTHEPRRGSKKKRNSIESLEVDHELVEQQKESAGQSVDELELAFSPSPPVRGRFSKNAKVTEFMVRKPDNEIRREKRDGQIVAPNPVRKPAENRKFPNFSKLPPPATSSTSNCVSYNDPTAYGSDTSVLDATVILSSQKTPDRLMDTVPMGTPSPRGKRMKQRKLEFSPLPVKKLGEIEKRKQFEKKPVKQAKRRKTMKNEPTFDIGSPINLSDGDDEEENSNSNSNSNFAPKRESLMLEETQRREFGRHVADRAKMIDEMVDQRFLEQRENGDVERRRAELKDGEVIRNKEMRRNLMHGAANKYSREYYDRLGMEEHEKNEYIDRVSRQRYVHQALPDTPEHYWDLTLGPSDEDLMRQSQTSKNGWSWGEKKEKKGIATWHK